MLRTLIITNCSASKLKKDADALKPEDFINEQSKREKEERMEAKDSSLKQRALDMYTGGFYGNGEDCFFKHGYKCLKDNFENLSIDLYIVSAGYGLINENDYIYPYDVTYASSENEDKGFNAIKNIEVNGAKSFNKREKWGDHLKTREKLNEIIDNYDLILFFLSNDYLKAIHLKKPKLIIKENQRVIFFNKEEVLKGIINCHTFITSEDVRKECKKDIKENTNPRNFRGRLAYLVFKYAIDNGDKKDPLKVIYDNYNKLEKIIL